MKRNRRVRAVVCDVYGTLLAVDPAPADAAARWGRLWEAHLGGKPCLGWSELGEAIQRAVRREHARARSQGIPHPEVGWERLMLGVVPELAGLARAAREEFLFCQAQIWHGVRLMPGAALALRALRASKVTLGIASNAQPYSLRELDQALATEGLSRRMFDSDLCFWSFAHGFSKPDPHVFRILGTRLRARGVEPDEILMIGDRVDNDLEPARKQGWRTWRLGPSDRGEPGGGWPDFVRAWNAV